MFDIENTANSRPPNLEQGITDLPKAGDLRERSPTEFELLTLSISAGSSTSEEDREREIEHHSEVRDSFDGDYKTDNTLTRRKSRLRSDTSDGETEFIERKKARRDSEPPKDYRIFEEITVYYTKTVDNDRNKILSAYIKPFLPWILTEINGGREPIGGHPANMVIWTKDLKELRQKVFEQLWKIPPRAEKNHSFSHGFVRVPAFSQPHDCTKLH